MKVGAKKMNHSLIDDNSSAKYSDANDKAIGGFEQLYYDDTRSGLLSEDKQQSFLPRLDASQRYSNSQVMYRDLDENNKSQVREMIDMSMKSPANSWMINDSLQRIGA